MDHFQSSSKASLLDLLKEKREGQLGTHADAEQIDILVHQNGFDQVLQTY